MEPKGLIYGRSGKMDEMFVRVNLLPSARLKPLIPRRLPLFALMLLSSASLLAASGTGAYFADAEASSDNGFAAELLDFSVSPVSADFTLAPGETTTTILSVLLAPGSVPFSYAVSATASSSPFCVALMGSGSAPFPYVGTLASLSTASTTALDPWSLEVSFPDGSGVVNGDTCSVTLTYVAAQEGAAGQFHDEETATFVFHASIPEPELTPFFAAPSPDAPAGTSTDPVPPEIPSAPFEEASSTPPTTE